MNRNTLVVLGLGMLLGAGLFAPGCGDDNTASPKRDGAVDGKADSAAGGSGGSTGGVKGTGGVMSTGGTTGVDSGAGGTGGATGTGGSTTVLPDAGPDVKFDAVIKDVGDVPSDKSLPNPDGELDRPATETGPIDGGLDGAVQLDAQIDGGALDTGIDSQGVDGSNDAS